MTEAFASAVRARPLTVAGRFVCLGLALGLAACGGGSGFLGANAPTQQVTMSGGMTPVPSDASAPMPQQQQQAQLQQPRHSGAIGVGVNSYLWHASLDTLAFMPLVSADPFGGTIITDWYAPPQTPEERFKATVYILDKTLRADALRVSVFRQTKDNGNWVDATVDPATAGKVENAILTRARQLRLADSASK